MTTDPLAELNARVTQLEQALTMALDSNKALYALIDGQRDRIAQLDASVVQVAQDGIDFNRTTIDEVVRLRAQVDQLQQS